METCCKSFQYKNGLVLLYEEMSWRNSFAVVTSVPAGAIWDVPGKWGLASLTCEMTNRGAGEFDNRQFLETLEYLGVSTAERAGSSYSVFGSSGLVDNWERALELSALQIRKPVFDEEEFDECRQIQLQEISAINDSPKSRCKNAFGPLIFPSPWGRFPLGTIETVCELTIEDVRRFHERRYRPNGTVIALTGRLDWECVKEKVGELFGDWSSKEEEDIEVKDSEQSSIHIECDSAQTHFMLGFPDVPFGHPDYRRLAGGIDVLSGGMSSRLFTEVREKRGLCYSVNASITTAESYGRVICYCGSSSEKAPQALDVIVHEIDRLSEAPVAESELARMKIGAKSDLVMQRESTRQRADAMIGDWRRLNCVPSLEEKIAMYDNLTTWDIESYFAARPHRRFRLASLGPEPLSLPSDRLY